MNPSKNKAALFFSFLKIGAFTFGGGYAMIALLRREFVEEKKWLSSEEFFDLVAVAESTPGPIAINAATYIGFRSCGLAGSLLATLGVCLPSFVIIYLISLFFDAFLSLKYVTYAFRGIQACVPYLILSAGIKMLKGLKKDVFSVTVFCLTLGCMLALSLFAVSFSSVFYILISGTLGLVFYGIGLLRKGSAEK
ncbi:MAG: chromate transporter [Lachnospiraceae bacterium]|nr:chromate transporter [Lachnospiraceae bacterium]